MKITSSFLGGVVVGVIAGALVFGTAFGLLGYVRAHSGEPYVIVRNLTQSPLTDVRIETDVGESYALKDTDPAGFSRTQISGRDKALWVVATTSTRETRKSEQIYVTSRGTVFVAVTEQSLTIDYAL